MILQTLQNQMWQLIMSRHSVCLLDFNFSDLCDELEKRSVLFCFKYYIFPDICIHRYLDTKHYCHNCLKKWSACFINTYMYITECRSNVKQYKPLSGCSWSGCALFAQVYICPNIWGKYSVLSCSKCDKYNNILIKVHCSNPKLCCSWPIICLIRPFIKSFVNKEVNLASLTLKSLIAFR